MLEIPEMPARVRDVGGGEIDEEAGRFALSYIVWLRVPRPIKSSRPRALAPTASKILKELGGIQVAVVTIHLSRN